MDKKLIAVLGGGLLVGAGVFSWYVFFGSDMVARDAAKKPIQQWEAEWQKARACLVGDGPAAADPIDTLAIRAFARGGELHCSLAGLARPEGQGSGIPEIEDAWGRIETAWHALAAAVPDAEKMGAQIRALDAADAALRAGARLPAIDPPKPGLAVADVVLGAPIDGSAGMVPDEVRGHAIVAIYDDRTITLRGPGDVTSRRDQSDTLRAWPDPSWGVTAEPSDDGKDATLEVGAVGADGVIADAGTALAKGHEYEPIVAVGAGAARQVIVVASAPGAEPHVESYRSSDGGAHWSRGKLDGTWSVPSWLGRVDPPVLLQSREDGTAIGLFDPATAELRALPTPFDGVGAACASGTAWMVDAADGSALLRVATGEPLSAPIPLGGHGELLACTADAIAVRAGGKILRCAKAGCDDGLDVPNHVGFADVYDGSGVVFAAQSGRVISVWQTGVAPIYLRAPTDAKLAAVAVWNKKPALAFVTKAGVQVAAMP